MKRHIDDPKYRDTTHDRWKERTNRPMNLGVGNRPARWVSEECYLCAFYCHLDGPMGEDYGACSNEASPMDGRVVFEHDGCDHFELVDD